uniref:Uncharacterized protein n=1 Tax=Globodera rostochiensis TaxID=31243 RepID=A0A914IE12_GLORO
MVTSFAKIVANVLIVGIAFYFLIFKGSYENLRDPFANSTFAAGNLPADIFLLLLVNVICLRLFRLLAQSMTVRRPHYLFMCFWVHFFLCRQHGTADGVSRLCTMASTGLHHVRIAVHPIWTFARSSSGKKKTLN